MLLYCDNWSSKLAFINSFIFYIISLLTTFVCLKFLKKGKKKFNQIFIFFLLPGIPPAPIFITKLWSLNLISLSCFNSVSFIILFTNLFLVFIYLNFFYYYITCNNFFFKKSNFNPTEVIFKFSTILIILFINSNFFLFT